MTKRSVSRHLPGITKRKLQVKNAIITKAMETVTPKQRDYVTAYTQGLTVEQIAQLYGVNKSTVSRTLNRGFKRIAKVFDLTIIVEEGEGIE